MIQNIILIQKDLRIGVIKLLYYIQFGHKNRNVRCSFREKKHTQLK